MCWHRTWGSRHRCSCGGGAVGRWPGSAPTSCASGRSGRGEECGLRRWVDEPGVDRWEGTFPSEQAAEGWAAVDALAGRYVAEGRCQRVEQARAQALMDLIRQQATIDVQLVVTVPAGAARGSGGRDGRADLGSRRPAHRWRALVRTCGWRSDDVGADPSKLHRVGADPSTALDRGTITRPATHPSTTPARSIVADVGAATSGPPTKASTDVAREGMASSSSGRAMHRVLRTDRRPRRRRRGRGARWRPHRGRGSVSRRPGARPPGVGRRLRPRRESTSRGTTRRTASARGPAGMVSTRFAECDVVTGALLDVGSRPR